MRKILIVVLLINSVLIKAQNSDFVTLKGRVIDDTAKEAIMGAVVFLRASDGSVFVDTTDKNGNYAFNNLKRNIKYYITTEQPLKYLKAEGSSSQFSTLGFEKNEVIIDLKLIPIPICGDPLPYVLFKKNKFDFFESLDSLEGLIMTLVDNENIVIEIAGYRSYDENKNVSIKRAIAVKDYMASKKINSERLIIKDKGCEPRVVYKSVFFKTESAIKKILSEKYIKSLKTEEERENARMECRTVVFRILRNDFKE